MSEIRQQQQQQKPNATCHALPATVIGPLSKYLSINSGLTRESNERGGSVINNSKSIRELARAAEHVEHFGKRRAVETSGRLLILVFDRPRDVI